MNVTSVLKKVEAIDELLISILVRLPPRSIFKFRCVSKRWYGIIGHPFFIRCYSALERSARILGIIETDDRREKMHIAQVNDVKIKKIPSGCGKLIHSSNGLVLCCNKSTYYVVNLVTGVWVALPWAHLDLEQVVLSCEENMSEIATRFSVVGVLAKGEKSNTMSIVTFSSKTCKWEKSTLVGSNTFNVSGDHPFVSNGVFHWRTFDSKLVVHDPKEDENYVQLIEEPTRLHPIPALTRSSHDNVLWAGRCTELDSVIKLWKLPKNEFGNYRQSTTITRDKWILVHKIKHPLLFNELPPQLLGYYKFEVEALIPSNPPSVVLSNGGSVSVYNPESQSIELIWYGNGTKFIPRYLQCLYMEPLFLSSYALTPHYAH